jgi:hypothetical protein
VTAKSLDASGRGAGSILFFGGLALAILDCKIAKGRLLHHWPEFDQTKLST